MSERGVSPLSVLDDEQWFRLVDLLLRDDRCGLRFVDARPRSRCDHTFVHTIQALTDLGHTSTQTSEAVRELRDAAAACDCELLLNVLGASGLCRAGIANGTVFTTFASYAATTPPRVLYWEEPDSALDSGWRVVGDDDTEDDFDDTQRATVVDASELVERFPIAHHVLLSPNGGEWEFDDPLGVYVRTETEP